MSPIEEEVTALLADLAAAAPVEDRPFPADAIAPLLAAGRGGRGDGRASGPDYPVEPALPPRRSSSRRRVLVAAAVLAVVALVGGLLLFDRASPSPVTASMAQLQVDTAALGTGRLAVVIENDLYVADGPTGAVWKLTDTGRGDEVSDVAFSADGEWVAFTVHDESGLWVSRWDGSEHHRIGRAPSRYSWSPTDDQLVFATRDQVRIAQTDGSSRALEGGPSPLPFTNVVWSPDGQSLAFAQEPYPGDQGSVIIVTPEGGDDPGWGKPSRYTTPADEVLAWPSESVVLVAGRFTGGAERSLQTALLASVDTEVLLGLPEGSLVSTSSDGSRVAAVLPGRPSIERCDLPPAPSPCGPVWFSAALDRTSAPSFSPTGRALAIVGTDAAGRAVLTVADASGTAAVEPAGALGEGIVLTEPPEVRSSFGTTVEPPQWIDEDHLLVRAGDRIDLVERTAGGGATTIPVVLGDRYLAPVDAYPGGTGLAYWVPR